MQQQKLPDTVGNYPIITRIIERTVNGSNKRACLNGNHSDLHRTAVRLDRDVTAAAGSNMGNMHLAAVCKEYLRRQYCLSQEGYQRLREIPEVIFKCNHRRKRSADGSSPGAVF